MFLRPNQSYRAYREDGVSCEPRPRRHRQHVVLHFRHDVRWGSGEEQEGNEPCSETWCPRRSRRRRACSFARQRDRVVLFGSPIPSPEHARNRGGQREWSFQKKIQWHFKCTFFRRQHARPYAVCILQKLCVRLASTPARTQCVFSRTFACASRSSLVSAPSTPASFRVKPISDCCGPSRRRCASRRRNAAGQAPKCCPHGSACATSLASVARSVACGVLTRSRLRSVRFVCGELIETWPALSRYVHTRVYRARARPTDFFPFPCQRVASHFTIFTAQRTQGTRGVPFLCTLEIFRKKCGKERRRQKYANYSRTAAAMHINANLDTLIWNAHQR